MYTYDYLIYLNNLKLEKLFTLVHFLNKNRRYNVLNVFSMPCYKITWHQLFHLQIFQWLPTAITVVAGISLFTGNYSTGTIQQCRTFLSGAVPDTCLPPPDVDVCLLCCGCVLLLAQILLAFLNRETFQTWRKENIIVV